jgi:hypothetical protein
MLAAMSTRTLKQVVICCSCIIATCSQSYGSGGLPTDEELIANLRRDMTPDQVVSLFGEPSGGRPENCIGCHFRYFAPTGMLTAQREGYTGFEVQFSDGKVQAWRIFRGYPSYNPSMPMPSIFKWEFRVLGILIIFGIASGLLIRIIPVGIQKYDNVLHVFARREISAERLPSEFQFITHETTLQEIIDRLGPCSREAWLPIDLEAELGSHFAVTKSGKRAILTFEYHLPYHAAVVAMPEYPFAPENRIRAVFYRPVQRELAESRFSER